LKVKIGINVPQYSDKGYISAGLRINAHGVGPGGEAVCVRHERIRAEHPAPPVVIK
jgi:hypothetical protein